MGAIVAIVGRPNVGKSTLFNRLTESRKAIVDEQSGVTRDRHYGKSDWGGKEFSLIDTGGYVAESKELWDKEIRKQVKIAMEEAHVLLFMVDCTTGITDLDSDMANILRKSKKPVLLCANKVDNSARQLDAAEFYNLGLGEVFNLSSVNGTGTGELLDELIKQLPEFEKEDEDFEGLPRIAVVGKPNVGKSSLVNALLGKERNIVTDVAGTTRDSLNTRFNAFDKNFFLIDTAGLRKKTKVNEDVEFYSTLRTIKAIESSDVCLLMIDAQEGIEAQDMSIFQVIQSNKKGLVILVNKWDLVEKETNTIKEFEEKIREKIAPFRDVPIIFTSALTKQRVLKALEVGLEVYENRIKKIPSSKLNEVMLPIIEHTAPPALKGKYIKIKYVSQIPTHAPTFVFFCNLPQYIREPYKRFLENKIRENFDFTGVPITVFMRRK
jgi:GTP-binding protein